GAPMAKSIDSIPRPISPFASEIVFPFSLAINSANSSVCSTISCLNLNKTCTLFPTEVSPQDTCAFLASCTASSTSSAEANGTVAIFSPLEGLYTYSYLSLFPVVISPFIKCVNVSNVVVVILFPPNIVFYFMNWLAYFSSLNKLKTYPCFHNLVCCYQDIHLVSLLESVHCHRK